MRIVDLLLAVRALPFLGRRYVCPCCGWHLRAFTRGGFSLRGRRKGYCPRCNAKARHRRLWLYLEDRTNLFTDRLAVLHVSPKYAVSRRLVRMANLNYVAGDIVHRPHASMRMDLTAVPVTDGSFDAVICVHVLEHIEDDRAAISEIHRVLKPGGWALISVPIRPDRPTYEDATIVTAAAREAAFGETTHVRLYGFDLRDRLSSAGFDVSVDFGSEIDDATRKRFGLLDDENIFMCRKSGGQP
ncbi:MAG: class I SAM-dependent methyltransferase [Actinomycetota bacterium]